MPPHVPQPYTPASAVNAEAGTHPIAAGAEELAAARAATGRSWQEFPYYASRYGERGWRFSLSDSGWLLAIASMSSSAARVQVDWLARVLAARGMPSYLLERHLTYLHEELSRAQASDPARYERLQECAAALEGERRARLPEEAFGALASDFDRAVGGCAERIANMGVVLVSATIDERRGLPRALESVVTWVLDASRFSVPWLDAVQRLVERTRAAMS